MRKVLGDECEKCEGRGYHEHKTGVISPHIPHIEEVAKEPCECILGNTEVLQSICERRGRKIIKLQNDLRMETEYYEWLVKEREDVLKLTLTKKHCPESIWTLVIKFLADC